MNRYPMKTRIDDNVVRNLRLVTDDDSTTVWEWDDVGKAGRALRVSVTPAERVGATTSWRVDDLVLDEQRGCGCSHPMYAWVPPVGKTASSSA